MLNRNEPDLTAPKLILDVQHYLKVCGEQPLQMGLYWIIMGIKYYVYHKYKGNRKKYYLHWNIDEDSSSYSTESFYS